MEAEPLKADPPKRKRRWFQFSLRTLMIVVTALTVPCAYVGWQAKTIKQRKSLLAEILAHHTVFLDHIADDPQHAIPWIRALLGDRAENVIILPMSTSKDCRQLVRDTFPEADVMTYHRTSDKTIKPLPWPDESPSLADQDD